MLLSDLETDAPDGEIIGTTNDFEKPLHDQFQGGRRSYMDGDTDPSKSTMSSSAYNCHQGSSHLEDAACAIPAQGYQNNKLDFSKNSYNPTNSVSESRPHAVGTRQVHGANCGGSSSYTNNGIPGGNPLKPRSTAYHNAPIMLNCSSSTHTRNCEESASSVSVLETANPHQLKKPNMITVNKDDMEDIKQRLRQDLMEQQARKAQGYYEPPADEVTDIESKPQTKLRGYQG